MNEKLIKRILDNQEGLRKAGIWTVVSLMCAWGVILITEKQVNDLEERISQLESERRFEKQLSDNLKDIDNEEDKNIEE